MSVTQILAIVFGLVGFQLYLMQVFVTVAALRRARRRPPLPQPVRRPRVSVLKPLSGLDDELAENLAGFAHQEDCDYEVLFGVASLDDPALVVARAFVEAHPHVDARIIHTDPDAGLNPKGAQLIGLEASATGEIIVVSDSNVRVGPRYIANLVAELSVPGVALVSNVLYGDGERTFGSTLENLMLTAFQATGIIGGWELTHGGALTITVGKSMAMWRRALHDIGGLGSVRNKLAEDQALGRAFHAAGHAVVLSFDAVQNPNVDGTMMQTLHRHTRWATTRRSIFVSGYAIEWILVPSIWATFALLVHPSTATALYVAAAFLTQTVGTQVIARALGRSVFVWWAWPLEVLRTWIYVGCWVAGWLNNRVRWRGHRLELGRDGELVPATEEGRALVRAAQEAAPCHRDVTALVVPSTQRQQVHS